MTTFNPEVEIARLGSRVKLRKEEAKDLRDEGEYLPAIESLADAVSMLEASPLYWGHELIDNPITAQKTLASHLADCLGMMGGNYRRLGRLNDALACFERGKVLEEATQFDVDSSYNLVNAIVLPLEMRSRPPAEQRDDILRAVTALERQVKGNRRSDRWAWADLGQCQLLLGQVDEAAISYGRVRDLGDEDTVKSVVSVLQRLAEAVESSEPTVAESLRQGIKAIEGIDRVYG